MKKDLGSGAGFKEWADAKLGSFATAPPSTKKYDFEAVAAKARQTPAFKHLEKTDRLRDEAKDASKKAEKSGSATDHAKAAELHTKALGAMREGEKYQGGPRDDDPHFHEKFTYKEHLDAASKAAHGASAAANASKSADDHSKAAEAHGHAVSAAKREGNPAKAAEHSGKIKEHQAASGKSDKSGGGGGDDDHPRDENGRFASK